MDTAQVLYSRIGKHLDPPIRKGFVTLRGGQRPIREGVCGRTGIAGKVVDYVEQTRSGSTRRKVVTPTLVELLWMFSTQRLVNPKKGIVSQRLSTGHVLAVTERQIYTNIEFTVPIPNVVMVPKQNDILRAIVGRKCLFLAFYERPAKVLENGLRWSVGRELEINGTLSSLDNTHVNLADAMTIVSTMPKNTAKDIRRLLILDEHTDKDWQKLQALTEGIPLSALQVLFSAQDREMSMAYRLWSE